MAAKGSKYISDDIAFSILSKLTLKSLKRFQCVRKSWSLLFENTRFMNMFRNNFLSNCSHSDDKTSLLLQLSGPYGHEILVYSLSGESFENKVKLDWLNPFEFEINFNIFGYGSINGILCINEPIECEVVLWNPATNESKLIPPSPSEKFEVSLPDLVKEFISFDVLYHLHGFGYDSVIDDYRVIRYVCFIATFRKKPPPLVKIHLELLFRDVSLDSLWEIYCLKSNSWRKLDVNMPYSLDSNGASQVYMDGVCHWLSDYDRKDGVCLVSFYLRNEVFFTTPIPSDIANSFKFEASWVNLVELNGSIALITYDENVTTFQISILGELGMKESWTKLFIVGPLSCVEHLIGSGTRGEIFFKRKDKEIAWFDLRTQMIEELGHKGRGPASRIIKYKKSILPIGGLSN